MREPFALGSAGGAAALYFVFPTGKRFAKASIHAAAWNSPLWIFRGAKLRKFTATVRSDFPTIWGIKECALAQAGRRAFGRFGAWVRRTKAGSLNYRERGSKEKSPP